MATTVEQVTYDFEPIDLTDKAIVISGGTTGIGRTAGVALASRGAKVLIFGRHEPELNDALRDIAATGGTVHGLTADQAKREDVKRVFEAADSKLGGVDILINNAAIGAGTLAEQEEGKEWEYVVDSNLKGYMACCQEAIPRMKKRGWGHIINIGSLSAKAREEGSDIYVATKSAIRGFTDSLSNELTDQGIKVTLIEPGLVSTNLFEMSEEERKKKLEGEEILKCEDIAECVLYCLEQPGRCTVDLVQIRPAKRPV